MDKKDRRWLNPEEELYDLSGLDSVEELKQELLHRLMLEEIIHRFAIGLIHPAAKNLSAILDDFVEVLGQFSGTDRCYIFLFGADGKSMDNTQEWAAPGISPEKQNLQGLPLDVFPWWVQRVQSGKVINILDVSKMPPEASAEQQILQMQDIQSLLVVPLAVEHRSIGFLGFDSVRGQKRWTRQDINLLQTVSGIIASSIEREKSLERVLQNEQRYRNLFEHSNDAIFLLDREGKHIKVNLKAGEMLGYDPEEIVSLSYRDLVAPEEIDDSDSTLSRVLRGELPPLYEKTMVRKDGSRVPVEINLSILRGPTGEPEILQSVVRDITFRKKAAQELFRMANEDALTGLFNRRKFSELVSRRLGQQTPFS
ncbi:MAG TPA: PAS domain S-box protein, partial [Thermotogota bacterium]|nr:PAS domain S-box protein [Thermotogota bacterium]HRW92706.1 PAS domain S-box protein [Thermotogota bacterium]